MKKIIIVVVLSFLAAFAVARWIYTEDSLLSFERPKAVTAFDSGLPVERRIAALEQAVSDERQARQWLQEEVLYLAEKRELLTVGNDTPPQLEGDAEPLHP